MASARLNKILETLTKEKAIQLQDELNAAYSDEVFQKRLREKWKKAGGDKIKQMQARQELMAEVGGPIVAKFGFENSKRGIHESKLAFERSSFGGDPDVQERFQKSAYLLDPDLSTSVAFKPNHLSNNEGASAGQGAGTGKPAVPFIGAKKTKKTVPVPGGRKDINPEFTPFVPMTLEKAIAMQHDLLAGFNTDEFRSKLLLTWKSMELSPEAYRKHYIREVVFEVQGPVMEKYGFERSYAGVLASLQALIPLESNEEIQRNTYYLLFLIDPVMQMKYADRQLSTMKVVSEDMKPLCTLEFDIAATFRYAKERIQGITGIPWQAQKLNLITPADVGFLESLGINSDHAAALDTHKKEQAETSAGTGGNQSDLEEAQANTGQRATAFQPPARASPQTAVTDEFLPEDDNPFGFQVEEDPVAPSEQPPAEPVAAEEADERQAFNRQSSSESARSEKDKQSPVQAFEQAKRKESTVKASPLSESIGELHDWELVSATIPIGRSAEIVLVQRSSTVLERLKQLCPAAPKAKGAKGKAKKMPTRKEILDSMVETVRSFPTEVFSDLDFLIPAVQLSPLSIKAVLKVAPPEVRANRNVISAAVGLSGQALQFASSELQDDHQLVSAAVDSDGWNLQFASERLKANRDLLLAAIETDGWAFQYAAPELQKDIELAGAAVAKCGWLITSLDPEMKNNITVVKRAVGKDPAVLADLSPSMRASREVVLEAVSRNGLVLEHAAEDLQSDREIVLAAVRNSGMALQFAEPKMKGVRDICLAAVKQDGGVFRLLEKWLQQDMEILLTAVKQDFSIIRQIHGDLKMKACAALGIETGKVASYEEAAAKAAKARADAEELEAATRATEMQEHLQALGLPADTTDPKTIKQQYRRLALTHHPDKNQDDPEGAKNRMVSINHAYDSLARLMEL